MSLYGPQLPPGFKPAHEDGDSEGKDQSPVIGPTLPPGFRTQVDIPQDSPECYGPPPPPSRSLVGPALPPGFSATKEDCFIGPTVPQGVIARPSHEEESDDDDIIGPLPSEAVTEDYVDDVSSEIEKRSRKMKQRLEGKDVEDIEQKRETWMTELPDNLGARIGLGPRTFKKESADPNVDRSGWTDTPADRARKAQEGEVPKKQQSLSSSRRSNKEEEREEELLRELEKYNKHKRPMSLVDMHKKKRKKEEKKKPERKEFNRDEDLKISRVDPKAARALMNNATFLTSKFSAGTSKFL